MPTVPQYEIGQIKNRGIRARQNINAPADAFGANVAKANMQFANTLQNVYEKQRDEYDQAVLREMDTKFSSFIRSSLTDDGGYLSMQGKSALDSKESTEASITKKLEELSKDLDPRIANQWNIMAQSRIESAYGKIDNHNRQETSNYNKLQTKSRIDNQHQEMAANYLDENAVQSAKNVGLTEVYAWLRQQGIDPSNPRDDGEKDIIKSTILDFTSKGHIEVIENLLAGNKPTMAGSYFEKYQKEIDSTLYGELRIKIENKNRDGRKLEAILKIDSMQLGIEEKLRMADELPSEIANDVRNALKSRHNDDNTIKKEREDKAYNAALDIMSKYGVGVAQEFTNWGQLIDEMGAKNRYDLRVKMDAATEKKTADDQKDARNVAKMAVFNGEEVTVEMWENMSGDDAIVLQNEIARREDVDATDEQKEAYDKAIRLIESEPDTTIKDLKDSGLWDGMSTQNIIDIQSFYNAKHTASQEAADKLTAQREFMRLSEMSSTDPEKFQKENLESYIGTIDDADLNTLRDLQKNPASVATFHSRKELIQSALGSMRLDYADYSKHGDKGDQVRRFIHGLDQRTQSFFDQNNRKPNDDEYKKILLEVQTNMVWDDQWKDEEVSLFTVDPDEHDHLYVKVGDEKVYLKNIKEVDRSKAVHFLKTNRLLSNEQNIAYLHNIPEEQLKKLIGVMKEKKETITVEGIYQAYQVIK